MTAIRSFHFVGRNLAEKWLDHGCLDEIDLDRDPERFKGGVINWVFQTYLRLRRPLQEAGFSVSFDEGFRAGAINIAHRDSLNRWLVPYYRHYIVGIRADRAPVLMCDWEIVQNGLSQLGPRQTFISHWPQPGLVVRDHRRDTRIENAAYLGRTGTTSQWLREPAFFDGLRSIGVDFSIRESAWSDYSQLDLVIAHRVESPTMLRQKPASKIVNAWLAGVPALVNDEPAFRELRRTPLDYWIIDSKDDVIAAITRLKNEPGLYRAMVLNGAERARDYSIEAVRASWLHLLLNEVVPDAERQFARQKMPALAGQAGRILQQKAQSKWFKWRYNLEVRQIRQEAFVARKPLDPS